MEEQNLAKKSRSVEESNLEIADTFQDAGTRPIEQSPDFLLSEQKNIDNEKKQSIPRKKTTKSDINSIPPLD